MPEDRDALIAHYHATRRDLMTALDGLDDAAMLDATIDGWSVTDHLAHLALWADIRAGEVTRISAGYESAYRLTPEQDDAFNAIAHEARRGWSPEQARWELEQARTRLLDALTRATPRGLQADRYGSAGLRSDHESEHAGWIRRWRSERGI
ncbi:MAG: maleylpyruvate isomerase N-terminal domain-containing protein [Dehalococcoidia bacterium]